MQFNGVTILSSILNFGTRDRGFDRNFVSYLPTFAAAAWYHSRIKPKPADLEAFLREVRAYAAGPYLLALDKGENLPDAVRGFDVVRRAFERIHGLVRRVPQGEPSQGHSRGPLPQMAPRRASHNGRYDSRFLAIDADDAGEAPETDPSSGYWPGRSWLRSTTTFRLSSISTRTLITGSAWPTPTSIGTGIIRPQGIPNRSPTSIHGPGIWPQHSAAIPVYSSFPQTAGTTWRRPSRLKYDLGHMFLDPSLEGPCPHHLLHPRPHGLSEPEGAKANEGGRRALLSGGTARCLERRDGPSSSVALIIMPLNRTRADGLVSIDEPRSCIFASLPIFESCWPSHPGLGTTGQQSWRS